MSSSRRRADPTTRFATDFGRLVERAPARIVTATCAPEIVRALDCARSLGLQVTVRGTGHSAAGQSTSDGGLLLVLEPPPSPPRLCGDGTLVEVAAGERWRRVDRFLAGHGLTIAVLADYLDLSVGGTISVGGYGVDSVRHGAQIHQVEALRIVTAEGRALWCSADAEADLFAMALAGLGQVGVIDRVRLRTVPRPRWLTLFDGHHGSLRELVESVAWLRHADPAEPPFFKAFWARGRFRSVYGLYEDHLQRALTVRPPAEIRDASRRRPRRRLAPAYRRARSASVALWLATFPNHRRLWSDFLLPAPALPDFCRLVEDLQRRRAFGDSLRSIYMLAVRPPPAPQRAPLEASAQTGELSFGVGLYAMIGRGRSEDLATVRRSMRLCLEACADLRGRPYLYGWHELDEALLERFYGGALDELTRVRRRVDPAGLLAAPLLALRERSVAETAPA